MRHASTFWPLIGIVIGMLMLAYASVPLYRMFCQVTGYGGTTRESAKLPETISDKVVTVRFNTDIDQNLPWKFTAPKPVKVRIGENKLVIFHAVNESGEATRGRAVYNVVPFEVGQYFNKIQCFCFKEQRLGPHQEADFPVSFFIDPEMLKDKETQELSNITLSYTFFSYESRNR